MILQEFDPCQSAIINPEDVHPDIKNLPKVAVSCFSSATFERMLGELGGEHVVNVSFANAAGSLATTKKGAIPAMPDREAICQCMEQKGLQ